MFSRAVILIVGRGTKAFRLENPRLNLYNSFAPYAVKTFSRHHNSIRELVNDGASITRAHPRRWTSSLGRQVCPGMIGPLGMSDYYCLTKAHGKCDRRTGTCHCNPGYMGVDCSGCQPTHVSKGDLCYPRQSCPRSNDAQASLECSGAGICNDTTGECECYSPHGASDCSISQCKRFDPLCLECTNTSCMRCLDGHYVESMRCRHCALEYDSLCASCNSRQCLTCLDPIIWRMHQSLRRGESNGLSKALELNVHLPYNALLPDQFGEIQPFQALNLNTIGRPMHARHMTRCEQGARGDAAWNCSFVSEMEQSVVCQNKGTLGWSSSTYTIAEGAKTLRLTIRRIGGSIGATSVQYMLQHVTTQEDDITDTASYTSSKVLHFDVGVTEVSFLLTIHDDRRFEGDEIATLRLSRPRGGATLGQQRSASIIIVDDDVHRASAQYSQIRNDWRIIAGSPSQVVILAYSGNGVKVRVGGDQFLVELNPSFFLMRLASVDPYHKWKLSRPTNAHRIATSIRDIGNGSYTGWLNVTQAGIYHQSARLVATGGLRGEYYCDSRISTNVRVDAQVNFRWEHVSRLASPSLEIGPNANFVRWTGHVCPTYDDEYDDEYVLHVYTEGGLGVRLWLDGRLIIDAWRFKKSMRHELSTSVRLTEENLHAITIEVHMGHTSCGKSVSLQWSHASTRAVISAGHLYYVDELTKSPILVQVVSTALSAQYTSSFGDGVVVGEAGHPLAFQIVLADIFGNRYNQRTNPFSTSPYAEVYNVELSSLYLLQHLDVLAFKIKDDDGASSLAVPVSLSVDVHHGIIRAHAIPTRSGAYDLNVSFGANYSYGPNAVSAPLAPGDLRGSPFEVEIVPTDLLARRCFATGSGLKSGVAGIIATFIIHAKDALGNSRKVSGDKFDVVAKYIADSRDSISANDAIVWGNTFDSGNGTYLASVRPVRQGRHELAVTANGLHIKGSPFMLTVDSNNASASASTADWGSGLIDATVNMSTQFIVSARDPYGNPVQGAETHITCELVSNHGCLCTPFAEKNGSVDCVYKPLVGGTDSLEVRYKGKHISGSPFEVLVGHGSAVGFGSLLMATTISRAVAGQTASFSAKLRDAGNNLVPDTGLSIYSNLSATLRHRAVIHKIVSTSVEFEKGSFKFSFRATLAGEYSLFVIDRVSRKQIAQSPGPLYVSPGAIDAGASIIQGQGVESHVVACAFTHVNVVARDKWGNSHFHQRENLVGVIVGGGAINGSGAVFQETIVVAGECLASGLYEIRYFPRVAGPHTLHFFFLEPGIDRSIYTGLNLPQSMVKRPEVNIDWAAPKNQMGVALTADMFSMRYVGRIQFPFRQDVKFRIDADPDAVLLFKIDGVVILNSSPQRAVSDDSGDRAQNMEGMFYPSSRDLLHVFELTYLHKHGGNAYVRVHWASPSMIDFMLIPNLAFFRTCPVGPQKIDLEVVPGPTDGQMSTIEKHRSIYQATSWNPIAEIDARDSCANLRHHGGDHLVVFIDGPGDVRIGANLTDFANGTYDVSAFIEASGFYSIRAHVKEPSGDLTQINSRDYKEGMTSHWIRQVLPGEIYKEASAVSGTPFVTGVFTGLPACVSLQTRGEVYNLRARVTHAEAKHIFATLSLVRQRPTSKPVFADMIPVRIIAINHPHSKVRRYVITFVLYTAGTYQLRIFVDGILMSSMPKVLTCLPGRMSASWSRLRTVGDQVQGLRGRHFIVQARDTFGNDVGSGGEAIRVQLRDVKMALGVVADRGDGTYHIRYSDSYLAAATYMIHIDLAQGMFPGNGGGGLTAEYFANSDLSGLPMVIREDRGPFMHDWGTGDLVAGVPDYVSVRWTGLIQSPYTTMIQLELRLSDSDDAARVLIDGGLIIESQKCTNITGKIKLLKGALHEITVEFYEYTGPAAIRLEWASPEIAKQPIAAYYLYPRSVPLRGSPFYYSIIP